MKNMHFIDHLEELRMRSLKSIIFIIIFSIIGYFFSDVIIDFLIKPESYAITGQTVFLGGV